MRYKILQVSTVNHKVRVLYDYFICPYCNAEVFINDQIKKGEYVRCNCGKKSLMNFNYPLTL